MSLWTLCLLDIFSNYLRFMRIRFILCLSLKYSPLSLSLFAVSLSSRVLFRVHLELCKADDIISIAKRPARNVHQVSLGCKHFVKSEILWSKHFISSDSQVGWYLGDTGMKTFGLISLAWDANFLSVIKTFHLIGFLVVVIIGKGSILLSLRNEVTLLWYCMSWIITLRSWA